MKASLAHYPAPVRLLIFLVVLVLLWLPLAIPIALLIRDPNTETIAAMSLLFLEFLILVKVWGKRVHQDPHIFRTYGLVGSPLAGIEWFAGLSIGLTTLLLLFCLQGWLGWLVWQPIAPLPLRVILEGFLSACGVGLAEELVFRGWVLDELDRDYRPSVSLWVSSLLFASLHFLKPLPDMIRTFPQFPGLVLLGLALVWAKRSTADVPLSAKSFPLPGKLRGRLGLSIGLHSGLVWGYYIVSIGALVNNTHRVPDWITGIDGNPLAGILGVLFLAGIARLMRWRLN